MGGCATKPSKLQAAGADMKEEEEEVGVVVEVVKKVVQVETREIEGGRKSLSLLFMENKKENMEDDTEESTKFGVQPPQNVDEDLKLPAASQEQKYAAAVITT